jgi:hypothetical protein
MKRAWWRQILNPSTLSMFPKLKGVSFFDFIKLEDGSMRDFTMFGSYNLDINSPFGNDGGILDGATLSAMQADLKGEYKNVIKWGNYLNQTEITTTPLKTTSTPKADSNGSSMTMIKRLPLLFVAIMMV